MIWLLVGAALPLLILVGWAIYVLVGAKAYGPGHFDDQDPA